MVIVADEIAQLLKDAMEFLVDGLVADVEQVAQVDESHLLAVISVSGLDKGALRRAESADGIGQQLLQVALVVVPVAAPARREFVDATAVEGVAIHEAVFIPSRLQVDGKQFAKLVLHGVFDGLACVRFEGESASGVERLGCFKQGFVARAGHVAFTQAVVVTKLIHKLCFLFFNKKEESLHQIGQIGFFAGLRLGSRAAKGVVIVLHLCVICFGDQWVSDVFS